MEEENEKVIMEEEKEKVIRVKKLVIHADEVHIINNHGGYASHPENESAVNRGREPWRGPWDMFWGYREEPITKEDD